MQIQSSLRETMVGVRVVLFPLPFQGHINPMLQLAEILYSKGFSITIIHTQFNSLAPSNYPHFFTFRSIPDGLSETEISGAGGGVLQLITLLNTRCVEPFRNCLGEELAAAQSVGCLITDAHWHFTQGVADAFGVPRIVLRTGNISAFLAILALPPLSHSPQENMEDPVPDLPYLKMKDLPTVKSRQNRHVTEQLLSSVLRQTKASSGLIFNSFDALEHEPLLRCRNFFSPIPIFPLGPFHKHLPPTIPTPAFPPQDHTSIISWLNTNPPKSVLYVSFGTLAAVDREEFVEIAWGLAKCSYPFLWVVRPGMVSGSDWLPEGFDERWARGGGGLVVKWAPQQEVLAHPAVGGFWTHSGWNSTIESICEGVPMLCYPFFGDQMANARYVCDVWGIGTLLERGEIEKRIRKFMMERESGGMMNRIMGFKDMADSCLKEGGSTFLSLQNFVNYILNM